MCKQVSSAAVKKNYKFVWRLMRDQSESSKNTHQTLANLARANSSFTCLSPLTFVAIVVVVVDFMAVVVVIEI